MSNWSVAGPPEQWPMPGIAKKRAKFEASPQWFALSTSYQALVSSIEKIASLTP